MKNKILNLIKSAVWFVLCLLVGALIFEGIRSLVKAASLQKSSVQQYSPRKGTTIC